jgi:hypothetical protein
VTEPQQTPPPDPITALTEAAASLHEMFLAYVKAGFTEQQALYLAGQILTAHVRGRKE